MRIFPIVMILIASSLSGCLGVFLNEKMLLVGSTQQIAVNTIPSGASCKFSRQGFDIGNIKETPGSVEVTKTKDAITISCDKPGYQNASYMIYPQPDDTTATNAILQSTVGWSMDSEMGTEFKYLDKVEIPLSK